MPKKTALISAVVAAAITAAAFLSNPSPERHRARIKEALAERSPVKAMFGIAALTAFVSEYHPLGIASYTTVDGRTASIGAFGMVFVPERSGDK